MSEIRKYFDSRFTDGHLMEFDFSQLEVIVLAHLSQDKQLMQDIIDGVDMHTANAAKMLNKSEFKVTASERKLAKRFSFQLQYGAGAKSMAKSNGVGIQFAKDFIEAYYGRYPRVKEWQDENIAAVRQLECLVRAGLRMGIRRA